MLVIFIIFRQKSSIISKNISTFDAKIFYQTLKKSFYV